MTTFTRITTVSSVLASARSISCHALMLLLGFAITTSAFGQNAPERRTTPSSPKQAQAMVRLQLKPTTAFIVSGPDTSEVEDPSELFFVSLEPEESLQPTRLLGSYRRLNDACIFTPRFPLRSGLRYQVYPLAPALQDALSGQRLVFELPRVEPSTEPEIDMVYPSADRLPENLLKFYIHFSEPMKRGAAYEHIELLHGDEVIEHPFLELGEELWDAEQTRFTLFLHPGRIKRGLRPREEDGPPLAPGKEYTLRIQSSWTAASGNQLSESFEKKFRVTVADHQQPDLEAWKIETPPKDSREPVRLIFNEPLDHAMLGRVLVVKHQSGRIIEGEIQIRENEQQWEYVPAEAWPVGTYRIEVAANLEDLCGNSIARPFEVKMQERTAALPSTQVAIEFIVK